MLYLRRFETHNDWVERKLDLPYPVVSWELDFNVFNIGEIWNSFYMTYSVQDPGEIQILSDNFDISNLTDLYIDGERFDPKKMVVNGDSNRMTLILFSRMIITVRILRIIL